MTSVLMTQTISLLFKGLLYVHFSRETSSLGAKSPTQPLPFTLTGKRNGHRRIWAASDSKCSSWLHSHPFVRGKIVPYYLLSFTCTKILFCYFCLTLFTVSLHKSKSWAIIFVWSKAVNALEENKPVTFNKYYRELLIPPLQCFQLHNKQEKSM